MYIVISEQVHADAIAALKDVADVVYDANLFKDRGRLVELVKDAEALIVRNATRVDRALLEHARNLAVVGRVGVGLDNLDLPALGARAVTVVWAPGTNAVSVAEYVLGAMLELSRRLSSVSRELHAGRWDRFAAVGSELFGKVLGIVGLGDIGGRLAKRAVALGMRVWASDPVLHGSSFAVQEVPVKLVGLDELLAGSDFVSLHAPLTEKTENLVDEAALQAMKSSAFLINTARGGLLDEAALARAVREGWIAGAALDVRRQEPPGDRDPLRGLGNVLLTPHVAGVTHESNRRASLHVADDVLRVLRHERPLTAVALRA